MLDKKSVVNFFELEIQRVESANPREVQYLCVSKILNALKLPSIYVVSTRQLVRFITANFTDFSFTGFKELQKTAKFARRCSVFFVLGVLNRISISAWQLVFCKWIIVRCSSGVHSRILNVMKQSTVFETKNRFIHGAISMQFSILLSSFWPINRFWYRSLFSYTLLLRSIARQTVNWIFS